jgi:hypothetical protein
MPTTILDPWGQPYSYSGELYAAPLDASGWRTRYHSMLADYQAMLNPWSWREAVSDCRRLARAGLVSACSIQKWQYISASKWTPVYTGEDAAWGDEAEAALHEADKLANIRGPRFSFARTFELGGRAWDCDGAFFLLCTSSASGFPQFQAIEAHRIGQRDNTADNNGRVASGPYRRLRIANGIITDDRGLEVAYHVLGEKPEDDITISARDLWHIAPAQHFSEGRPLPLIAPAVRDLYAVTTARRAQSVQLEIDSKLTFIETTATGTRDASRDALNPPKTPKGTPTELVEDGMTRYIKTGNTLTPHESRRPSNEWMNFDDKSLKTAVAAMGWRAEMLDPGLMSTGAPTRAFQDIINTTILRSYEEMVPWVIRARQYQVAKLIEQKKLRKIDSWYQWDSVPPPEFTVDPSRSIASDLEAARAGADNIPNIQRRWGLKPKETLIAQARWLQLRNRIAQDYDVTPEDLGRLDKPGQLNAANVPAGATPQTAPPAP